MWGSWWTKRGLGRFFTGFLPFSPTINFIPPFLHIHLIRFISSALVMVRQAWSAGTLATHGPIIWGLHRISSLYPTLCWTRVEDVLILFIRNLSFHEFTRRFHRWAAPWRKPLVARLPPLGSQVRDSMWVSWWTKRNLSRFYSVFLTFSPTTNFIPPFLHAHLISFVSFHQSLRWCDRRDRPAPLLFTDLQYRGFIASHSSTRPCVGH